VHEIADVVDSHAAVAHDLIRAGVEGHDTVEDAGMGRRIELEEQFLHGRVRRPGSSAFARAAAGQIRPGG
jgi:hypothetical protein